ncbi:nucleoside-diphosphate kinase [Candidatus Aerophobetes bacterium]|uniref:nucleoside-diphosphate kinase n=1 Tax=Aerophobetes bacterium TaxID=2030807 RepID=A0A523THK0_UNCAE|nr:MAG: nucleoside-diphosphate kinase [Candidatus Aerophobetes bacterium]
MKKELAYVLINPYTIRKSRTGGVISRLLSWGNLSLVAARMFCPSRELVEEYTDALYLSGQKGDEQEKEILEQIRNYLFQNYLPSEMYPFPRVMLLLLEGEGATLELKRVVGHITHISLGETIRGTYGDYIEEEGKIKYFEPAVFIGNGREETIREVKIWAKYSARDGGVLEKVISYPPGVRPERTLVLIKPDSFQELSCRAGNIIDRFSQTGLFIIGTRIIRMGIEQAEEFYEPIKGRLVEKMKKQLMGPIRSFLDDSLDFPVPEGVEKIIAEELKIYKANNQFNRIVKFMTGRDPQKAFPQERKKEGLEKCLALVYEGEGAIEKIRKVLGETNPEEAAPGTVRKDFGRTVMMNVAHAADSPASARREMAIVRVGDDDIKRVVEEYYGKV